MTIVVIVQLLNSLCFNIHSLPGNSPDRGIRIVDLLNKHFQYLLKKNDAPSYQVVDAYEAIVREKPYKILPVTFMLFKVNFTE